MTDTVYYASALMGSGKTQKLIDNIDPDENIVIAVPKIDLSSSIAERIRKSGLDCDVINSNDNRKGPVRKRVERALTEGREGSVIIITQATLMNIDPTSLQGWKVVVDEVPRINKNDFKSVGFSNFDRLFSGLVDVDEEGVCSIKDGMEHKVRECYADDIQSEITPSALLLGGLLSPTAEVSLKPQEAKWLIKVHDYSDYRQVIDNADEFHIMGNGVEKTLFHLFIKQVGYKIERSCYTPDFDGYKLPPTLVPLVGGDKFSKKMMLMREDGTDSDSFDETCIGWKLFEKALDFHRGEPVLVQVYKWMRVFPFEDYDNAEVTDFDLRGLNDYSEYHRTVNLPHGNPDPIQSQMNSRLFEMMGIDPSEGREAIRYERHIDPISQTILRTDMRNGDAQEKATVSIVPTMKVAEALQEALQIDCNIDTSIMIEPPVKAPTRTKLAKAELQARAREMKAGGMSARAIAKELGVKSPQTIVNWTKQAS